MPNIGQRVKITKSFCQGLISQPGTITKVVVTKSNVYFGVQLDNYVEWPGVRYGTSWHKELELEVQKEDLVKLPKRHFSLGNRAIFISYKLMRIVLCEHHNDQWHLSGLASSIEEVNAFLQMQKIPKDFLDSVKWLFAVLVDQGRHEFDVTVPPWE